VNAHTCQLRHVRADLGYGLEEDGTTWLQADGRYMAEVYGAGLSTAWFTTYGEARAYVLAHAS
jgi:hypothetical protein